MGDRKLRPLSFISTRERVVNGLRNAKADGAHRGVSHFHNLLIALDFYIQLNPTKSKWGRHLCADEREL